ncbi:flagellar basal body rod protein FlgB [mine drainage metagenome]|uniref:Flagellar basal body rod protein FlgB n=1 Tax=mine drainage metagenome TaxID=410659 RepID=A0A1J5TFI5_9ZZZZ|nr:flagellar basal body protein [Methylotenera sp.]MDP1958626.1 flagellar basal body protein [Methylotenera sp.]
MANILGLSNLPLSNVDSSVKREAKSLIPLAGTFSEALARVRDREPATTSVNGYKNFALVVPKSPLSTYVTPSHFQLVSARAVDEDSLNERALGLRAYRQELLASNIANADTPGYKAVDFDIQEALRTGKTAKTVEVKYVIPSQGSVDGNTVEMDVERVKFAENALMYEYHVDRVRGHYKDMEDLLKNTPY